MTVPVFSDHEVAQFWAAFSAEASELVGRMDRTERWTLDHEPAIAQRLIALGNRMHAPAQARRVLSADTDDLLLFLAYLSTSRALRFVHRLDELGGHGSEMITRLLETGGVDALVPTRPLRDLLQHRLRVFSNTPFFARLFAPERLRRVVRAIDAYRAQRGQ